MQQHLTRAEQANLIAGHAVAYATAYLDGRHTAQQLADNADRLFLDLLVIETAETSTFLVPVQLLAVTMMRPRAARSRIRSIPIRGQSAGTLSWPRCRARLPRKPPPHKGPIMKPLSEHMTVLIATAEDMMRRPVHQIPTHLPAGFSEVAAAIKQADNSPCDAPSAPRAPAS
jgi:hypothetical protein